MRYCIGVDLGGTNIAVGLLELDGKVIVSKKSTKTLAPRSVESIADDMAMLCRAVTADAGIGLSDVEWIGIGAPGVVKDDVIVVAPNLEWKDANIADALREKTGIPTYVANDANAAAYAEYVWGCGVGASSLVAFTLGTGVGGGIVINGRIWEGINGFAAEIGHMVIEEGGRQCGCGKRGCIEAYCSASALVKEAKRAMKLYPDSKLWELTGGSIERMNGYYPFVAKAAGDFAASEVVDSFINYLAIGIANIVNILQPEIVCVGGGISGEGDNLLIPLRNRVKYLTFGTETSRTRIEIAKYRNDAGIIGAGLLGLMRRS